MARKGPMCSICQHAEVAPMTTAMIRGVSVPALARRYQVSVDSLRRHKANHVSAAERAAILAGPELAGVDVAQLRKVEEQSSLANLVAIRHRLWSALSFAEENGDVNQIARITAQLHKNVELSSMMVGALHTGGTTINNHVLISTEYISLRVSLVKALQAFPDAAQAVAGVLHALESKAADNIAAEATKGLTR
jgi:hypothetical protein